MKLLLKVALSAGLLSSTVHYGQGGSIEAMLHNQEAKITVEGITQLEKKLALDNSATGLKMQKKFGRYLFQLKSASINPDGTLDQDAYSRAVRSFVESDLYCSDDEVSEWSPVGPLNVGQDNGWVSAVYVDPENEDRMIIGGRQNGLFLTENHGVNWTSLTDDLHYPVIGVNQIVTDPSDINHLIALTGYKMDNTPIHQRLMHSYDRGATWEFGPTEFSTGEEINHLSRIMYHPSIPGLVYTVSSDQIGYSDVSGSSWKILPNPAEFGPTYRFHTVMVTNANTIFVAAAAKWSPGAHIWKGDVAADMSVTWTLIDDDFFIAPPKTIDYTSIAAVYESAGGFGDPAKLDHNGDISDTYWYRINSSENSWSLITSAVTGEQTLTNDNSFLEDQEALTLVKGIAHRTLLISPTTKLKLKYRLPAGLRFKITAQLYSNNPTEDLFYNHPSIKFDYGFMFENVIYDSGVHGVDTEIDGGVFDFELTDAELPYGIPSTNILYAITLEKDDALYTAGQLELDYIHFFNPEHPNLSFVDFSNYTDEKFLVEASPVNLAGGATASSNIYLTENDGEDFSMLGLTTDVGAPEKNELILSLNDPNVFYKGIVGNIKRYSISAGTSFSVNDMGGHHDDYRSSLIVDRMGEDYMLLGNDGGVAEISNGLVPVPQIHSLNGDLQINLIYTLSVHEKTGNILIGLQDNGTYYYDASTGSWDQRDVGDGSLSYIHPDNENHIFFGDPQLDDNAALKEEGGDILVDMTGWIEKWEGFLGMRLEPYRSNPDRFIVGLKYNKFIPGATSHIIFNYGELSTAKLPIPDCSDVLGIGISETDHDLLFVTDGALSVPDVDGKLFKSVDEGASWEPLGTKNVVLSDETVSLGSKLGYSFLSDVVIDPGSNDIVFASVSGIGKNASGEVTNGYFRVIKSIDQGESWTDYSDGLPALPVNKLLAVHSDIGLLFAGTDAGVYYRTNDMDQWECFSNELPLTSITDLEYNYCTKELYASTYGRGVYKTPVDMNINLSTSVTEITSDATWLDDKEFQNNLVIKSGVTLVIKSTVTMYPDTKIIVEPDAHLIVDGAHLTSSCNEFWHGIEVWGNSSLPQVGVGAVQGKLTVKLNSTIENAAEAIVNWKAGDWTSTGGIVRAYNSTFLNCKRSAAFLTYLHPSMSIYGYQGLFEDCVFEWNDDFLAEKPQPHVTMLKVNGILFSGCDFLDNRSDVIEANAGTGIRSIGANYSVRGKYITAVASPEDEYYDETGYDISHFTGLLKGIEALNTSYSLKPVTVDHVSFVNCKSGVYLSSVDGAIVTRNNFSQRASVRSWAISSIHLYSIYSGAFQIEGNVFNGGENCIGTFTEHSGSCDNLIYKNKYSSLMIGSYAKNYNGNGSITRPFGLKYECNGYSRNDYADIYVYAIASTMGIRLVQGSPAKPAGNIFNTVPDYHLYLSPVVPAMNYHYETTSPLFNPVNRTPNVTTIPSANTNRCISSYAGLTIGAEEGELGRRMPVDTSVYLADVEAAFPLETLAQRELYLINRAHLPKEELVAYSTFVAELKEIVGTDSTYDNSNRQLYNFLIETSKSENGVSATEAQNLLCFYWGECGKPEMLLHSDQPLAENNGDSPLDVSISPNPASESVNVLLTNDPAFEKSLMIRLLDVNGRLLMEKSLVNRNTVISLSNISDGVYFIEVINNEGTVKMEKLIVQ